MICKANLPMPFLWGGAALFASIGPIRINNIEAKRQPIRQVVPEYPALLPATSR